MLYAGFVNFVGFAGFGSFESFVNFVNFVFLGPNQGPYRVVFLKCHYLG